ncbi:carbon-nitrogen hydrolase family protein [Bernardetia litoralis]|nr:carbon-nitrogen hydrolase family protein [Bernardetia litoralis]
MKISIAQIKLIKGNISTNIKKHLELIELAISHNAKAIFFPELSLTGYEPTLAQYLAFMEENQQLAIFQEISDTHKINIGVGVPKNEKIDNYKARIKISMAIFQPNQSKKFYSKQQLHDDELPYFEKGNKQLILNINTLKLAPAICYESLQNNHAHTASTLGANIYIASVAKSENGFTKAISHYSKIAKIYSMPVLMANSIGFCDNFLSVGKSSVWTKDGVLVKQLNDKNEGILIFDTKNENIILDYL